MKKICTVAVLFLCIVMFGSGITAFAEPGSNAAAESHEALPAAAAAALTQITCGVMQDGTFGAMPETHQYSVYLQGAKALPLCPAVLRSSL
ncbi:MAG: hypothetical protein KH354_08620 [Clostridiales bacterium]|nr:hypothetical protein [Clostridiales bacterium]